MQTSHICDKNCPHFNPDGGDYSWHMERINNDGVIRWMSIHTDEQYQFLLKKIAALETECTLLKNTIVASAVALALKSNYTSQGQ